jgi:hypothetical protein
MQHRKLESPDSYPWTQIGISERRYYKLLPLFAQKINGRYDIDLADVVARMKVYLDSRDSDRSLRTAALDLLQERGFSEGAARKWLQRHRPEDALDAWPRGRRPYWVGRRIAAAVVEFQPTTRGDLSWTPPGPRLVLRLVGDRFDVVAPTGFEPALPP